MASGDVRRRATAEEIFAVLSLLYFSGSFSKLLAGREVTAANGLGVETPAIQYIGVAIYCCSMALLFLKGTRQLWSANTFFLILLHLITIASAFSSADPAVSLRRSLSLVGTSLFAYYLFSSFRGERLSRVLYNFARMFLLLNLATMAVPSFGFHNSGDAFYTEHAGSFRGLYFHKNDFAKYNSIVVVILAAIWFTRTDRLFRRSAWYLLLSVALLSFSRSASAFASVPIAVLAMLFFLRVKNTFSRVIVAVSGAVAVSLFVYAGPLDQLIEYLATSLGRDPTLSHRTEIWESVLMINRDFWLLGRGYGVAWASGIGDQLAMLIGTDVGNPHNGFLDVWLNTGMVGLATLSIFLLITIARLLRGGGNVEDQASRLFAQGFIVLFLVLNLAGSNMMRYNDLFWVTLVLCALSSQRSRDSAQTSFPAIRAQEASPMATTYGERQSYHRER